MTLLIVHEDSFIVHFLLAQTFSQGRSVRHELSIVGWGNSWKLIQLEADTAAPVK